MVNFLQSNVHTDYKSTSDLQFLIVVLEVVTDDGYYTAVGQSSSLIVVYRR